MTTVTEEFALLIDAAGFGTYPTDPDDTSGSIFLHTQPAEPDEAITVARYAGPDSDSLQGYDLVAFQVRVRGPRHDVGAAETTAQAVYDALHGMRSRALPGGTWLVHLLGTQAGPVFTSVDAKQRAEFVLNFRAELRRITANRQ